MNKKLLLSAIALATITANAEYIYKPNIDTSLYISASNSGPVRTSCKEILDNGESTGDGIYTINPQGNGNISIYCDMTTDGGGWTLITHIYDRDDRNDIADSNMTDGWGNTGNTPNSDTSFNLATADDPSYTESLWEWRYPLYGEVYSHTGSNTLTADRWVWSYGHGGLAQNLSVNSSTGLKTGVFGTTNEIRGVQENCGANLGAHYTDGLHYWGWGGVLPKNALTGPELHNLHNGYNRATTGNVGCGTRESIFNIYVR